MEQPTPRSPEDASKDEYFRRIADIAQEMIAEHGKDFATGAFVLAARWIAEGKMVPPQHQRN
ncbi:MAG: hypothetical protein AAFT19_00445 [Pseudomonadota bacterium]